MRNETVVCINGEGRVQMCMQELSTIKQYGLTSKISNIKNQALGRVKR